MNRRAPGRCTGRLRQRLLARISRKYRTETEIVAIGPLRFSFTRISDPNRVLDEVADEEDRREKKSGERREGDDLHLPYWAEVWDSAFGIGQYLAREGLWMERSASPWARECSVLDLGCGMGLAGTTAAALGARVMFADLETPALLFASLNAMPWRQRVRTRRLNWQRDKLGEQFDLILGADIIYERKQWEFLEAFWLEHLKEDGRVLVGEPGRQSGDGFLEWIGGGKWDVRRFDENVMSRRRGIRMIELRAKAK